MNNNKDKALASFKKAAGLLDKVIAMTEGGDYCVDIMQQNLATIGVLRGAHELLMEGHLKSCFSDAVASKSVEKKNKMVEEILKVSKLVNR